MGDNLPSNSASSNDLPVDIRLYRLVYENKRVRISTLDDNVAFCSWLDDEGDVVDCINIPLEVIEIIEELKSESNRKRDADAGRELREAAWKARGLLIMIEAGNGEAELARLAGRARRELDAALDRSPAPFPAPPALDEEVRELVAACRHAHDAARGFLWKTSSRNGAKLSRTLDELNIAVAALERKAGEAKRRDDDGGDREIGERFARALAEITVAGRASHDEPEESDKEAASYARGFQDALDLAPVPNLNIYSTLCHNANKRWWHNPATGKPIERNIGEMLMLAVSELSEAMEGERKNLQDDKLPHRRMLEVEIADCFIRLFDLCGGLGLDINGAFLEKMEYNRNRVDHTDEARLAEGGKKF